MDDDTTLSSTDEIKNRKNSKEKLSVHFENLSIDNDTDLTEIGENEDSSKIKFNSDYFTNESFFRDDFIKLAEDVIGEKENWKMQDINTLREMLRNYDESLAKELTSDELLKFLRSKCFDYDNTLTSIKNYHTLIKSNRDYYFQPISKLSEMFSDNVIYVLPCLVKQVITVIITPENYDSTKHSYNQFLSALFHTLERILYSEIAQITGINFIIDLQSFSISKLKKFSPINAKKMIFYLEETFPIRINSVYIVGSKMISHLVYALNKPFLSQLLRSKIEFVNLTRLHEIYSTEIITKALGGKQEIHSDKWFLELVRAESLTCLFWDKFYKIGNLNSTKTTEITEEINKSDNNLLDSQSNGCNNNGHTNFVPSFLQILPSSCSDYILPTPVYK